MSYFLECAELGKRFGREWIFRGFGHVFRTGVPTALVGSNGSGKSTLLQVIAQSMEPTAGTLLLRHNETPLAYDAPAHLSMAAPYLELIEEMTALELLHFHFRFKPVVPDVSPAQLLDAVQLGRAGHKQIRLFSSGMKQRMKLALAFFADTPLLLLDEPCTNLDAAGYALFDGLMQRFADKRIVIIASNDEQEMRHCVERLLVADWNGRK